MDNPLNLSFTPFVQHLGVELVQVEKGHAEIRLTLQPHQENGLRGGAWWCHHDAYGCGDGLGGQVF